MVTIICSHTVQKNWIITHALLPSTTFQQLSLDTVLTTIRQMNIWSQIAQLVTVSLRIQLVTIICNHYDYKIDYIC